MNVLLTGATGFIGSNIAKKLLECNYNVFATCRNTSSFEKCIQFKDIINWINIEAHDWKQQIKNIQPDLLVHVAWSGIDTENRNNWEMQIRNFLLSKEFFDLAKEGCVKKVIALGSQAEYGFYSCPINEETVPKPYEAYGLIKSLTANYLRSLFENSKTEWYWIRIFSVFGEGESTRWLIPTVISKLLKNEPIPLTSCEQQYNYLYIGDLIDQILAIVQCNENKSGIFNLCNSGSIVLKELLAQIANLMGVSQKLLQFGETPYSTGQNMHIEGNNSKFRKHFTKKEEHQFGLTQGLLKTIEYYMEEAK